MKNNFYEQVYDIVKKIPKGKVATYGQVATLLGNPGSSRMVGWALNIAAPEKKIPWQRVINSKGIISIIHPQASKKLQAELLKKEGIDVKIVKNIYTIDLKKYLWQPKLRV